MTEIQGNALAVTSVKTGSPAERTGVHVGDAIATIDGRIVGDLGIERAQRLLASGNVSVGQTVTLALARGASVTMTAVTW